MGDKRLCDVCIKRSRFFVEHVVRAADFIHSFIHSFHYHSANFVLDRDMQKMTIVIHIYIDIYIRRQNEYGQICGDGTRGNYN